MAGVKKSVSAKIISLGIIAVIMSCALGFFIGARAQKLLSNSTQPTGVPMLPEQNGGSNNLNGATKITQDDVLMPNGEPTSPTSVDTPKNKEDNIVKEKPIVKADENFKVIGYYHDADVNGRDRIRYDIVTHIVYSFAIPNEDGTLKPLQNPENATAIIKEAHSKNVKVMLALGGWSYNDIPLEPIFKAATDTPEKINKLVSEMMKLIDTYGFDGVDIDWEHPRFGDVTQTQYLNLLKAFRKEVDKRDLLLTAAVLSGINADGVVMYDAAAHTDDAIALIDWLNIMAYDGGDAELHSSYNIAVNCVNYWTKTRNIAKEKVTLGVPFYGRPSWASYDAILAANPEAYKSDTSTINGVLAHYNGIDTITKKTDFAIQNAGGIMIWELAQDCLDDEKSLQVAIGKAIK